MGRTLRPILDAASGNLMLLLALHQDKPCPTDAEIVEWTGVPRRRLHGWFGELRRRGILELQYRRQNRPRRRRMRAVGGVWTDWTRRGRWT